MEDRFCVLERAFTDPSTSENAQSNLEPFVHHVLNVALITLSSVLPFVFFNVVAVHSSRRYLIPAILEQNLFLHQYVNLTFV